MRATSTVAIVGRPNVGKSTLFNRLIGRRQAIVHNQPGVTRDRIAGVASLVGERQVAVIDTGGLVPGDDPLGLNRQVLFAVGESDLLLFLVDGTTGLLPADQQIWSELRKTGKPAILVVNKADTKSATHGFAEFYALGIDPQLLISAEHGTGVEALREAVHARLPEHGALELSGDETRLAIVGRPNVGKSSILNRILGEERVLVSPIPGTTRDPIDTRIEHGGKSYLLIDTAGIRRRSRTSGEPEQLAVMMARRQVERAHLAMLVVSAEDGITTGDLGIAGSIWELGRPTVMLVNKWDLLSEDSRRKLDDSWPRLDQLLSSPRRVNVSALTGRAFEKILPAVEEALDVARLELSTAEVNRLFERAIARHQPPTKGKRPWKLYYATQVSTSPPTFMLFANQTLPVSSSYRRYLENYVTSELGLFGVPARLVIRRRS